MILSAWRDGYRRVLAAPALVAGVFAATVLSAVPLTIVMRGAIASHLGSSLTANAVADGVDSNWWQEFTFHASGVSTTFTPAILGFAATLDNISSILDARAEQAEVTGAIAVYLLAWIFLSGGIVDRYARQRPTRAHGFFAAAGVFFWRFARLGIIAGLAYWLLFTYVHAWLFDTLYDRLTRDLPSERAAFAWRAACYAAFGAALAFANMTIDYAKIRLVVEDRRSVLGAVKAALAFIVRHPGRTIGLYAANAFVFAVLIALWALLAPGAGRAGVSMWMAFAGAQIYVLARLVLKLQFLASQTSLFQGSLAHARYTAAPAPAWPESPAAELIGRHAG